MSLLDALIEDELFLPPLIVGGEAKREIWICHRTDGGSQNVFGAGTHDDPYDGSTYQKFDALMRNVAIIPANSTVRLGPGVFETRGTQDPVGWNVRNGRIIGSGMFQTTLKLVGFGGSTLRGQSCAIIGTVERLNGAEICDLTLDCNIVGQAATSPDLYARVNVSGIGFYGANCAVRRVRCINWGTQTPIWEYSGVLDSHECFPIFVAADIPTRDNNQ